MQLATKAAAPASAPAVPALDLTRTGKVDTFLNAMPAQPRPTDAARGTAKTARIEQRGLDAGVPLVFKEFVDHVRIAYDPQQIDALGARLAANIYVDFTEGEKIDGIREAGRNAETDGIREIFSILLDQTDRHGDVTAVLTCAEQLFTRVANEPAVLAGARCSRYSWCAETGDHAEHTGETITAACRDNYGDEVLHATLMDWGGQGVRVGFLEHDLTPADARTKLAELRAHLDAVEKLIDTAEAGE